MEFIKQKPTKRSLSKFDKCLLPSGLPGQESTLCFLPSERRWGPPSQLPLNHNRESRVEMSGRECCSPGGQSINQGQKTIIVSSASMRLGTSLASSAVVGLCHGLPPTGLSPLPHPLQFPRPLLSLPLFHWPHPSHHWPPTTGPAGFISGQPPLPCKTPQASPPHLLLQACNLIRSCPPMPRSETTAPSKAFSAFEGAHTHPTVLCARECNAHASVRQRW